MFNSSGVNKALGSPMTIKFAERIFSSLNSFLINAVYKLFKEKDCLDNLSNHISLDLFSIF